MTTVPPPPPVAASRRWRVVAAVGGVFVLAVVALLIWGKPLLYWSVWINGADKKEYRDKLLDETDPDLVPYLVSAMRNGSKGIRVRESVANILIKKNRLGEVEKALKDSSLDVRIVALRALSGQSYFRKQYAEEGSWEVAETLERWIADESRTDRVDAIDKVERVHAPPKAPASLLAALRRVLETSEPDSPLRGPAARELAAFQDCEALPTLVKAAATTTNPRGKLLLLQAVMQIWDNTASPCKASLSEDVVVGLVDGALTHAGDDDPNRAIRMWASTVLRTHSPWVAGRADRLRAVLASTAYPGERREALQALVAGRDPETLAALPRWFNDPQSILRSAAVQSLDSKMDHAPYEGCLIGIVRDEPANAKGGNPLAFEQALSRLRSAAGEWIGLPERVRKLGVTPDPEMRRRLQGLRETGRFEEPGAKEPITRDQVVEAWWRWLAAKNGAATPTDVDAVQALRADFWKKAQAGDVAGAKAVLEKEASARPNLWSYERGWLMAKGS